jgi:poly(hydroxyalkanoate) granule-associated protein
MVKKAAEIRATATSRRPPVGTVKESAQQIWLAGLGAISKAQEEGGKVFETLVKEGLSIQRKTQAVAEEKISEATNKMATMATDISSKASGQWDKLENIFEDRVSKALNKLGVPSAKDIDVLIARIDELNRNVAKPERQVKTANACTDRLPPSPAPSAAKRAPRKSADAPLSFTARALRRPFLRARLLCNICNALHWPHENLPSKASPHCPGPGRWRPAGGHL